MNTAQTIAGSFFSENPPPLKTLSYPRPDTGEETHFIKDNRGRSYRAEVYREMGPNFFVEDGDHRVAQALCKTSGTTFMLCDFLVLDNVPKPEHWLAGTIRWVLRQAKPRHNYRRRGLGTALLQFIIAWAAKHGMTEIRGSLSARDLAKFAGLKAWYEKNGFRILPGGDFDLGELYFTFPAKPQAISEASCQTPLSGVIL